MNLDGKKVAILLENNYNEFEFWYPYYRLKEAGATVSVVAPEAGTTYESKNHLPAASEVAARDVQGADFDALVIPGGYAPDQMRRHAAMVDLVRDAFGAGRVVAYICHAGWLAASAGILDGKTATGFFSIKDDLANAGATYVDEPVVRDGNLISSRKPDDLPDFCRTIIEALGE
jgi:protease I